MAMAPEYVWKANYKRWKKSVVSGKHRPITLREIEVRRRAIEDVLTPLEQQVSALQERRDEYIRHEAARIVESLPWWRRILPPAHSWAPSWRRALAPPDQYGLEALVRQTHKDFLDRSFEAKLHRLYTECRPLRAESSALDLEASFVRASVDEAKEEQAAKERRAKIRAAKEERKRREELRNRFIEEFSLKYDRRRFRVREKDYKRGNRLDNFFRTHLYQQVITAFNSQCVLCARADDLVLDHWGIPKNEGANFMLFDPDLLELVLNVAVFCRSCNSSKGERRPSEFIDEGRIRDVDKILLHLSSVILLNAKFRRTLAKWYDIDLLELFQVDQDDEQPQMQADTG
jgi:Ni/Co efflux regulator RcnB